MSCFACLCFELSDVNMALALTLFFVRALRRRTLHQHLLGRCQQWAARLDSLLATEANAMLACQVCLAPIQCEWLRNSCLSDRQYVTASLPRARCLDRRLCTNLRLHHQAACSSVYSGAGRRSPCTGHRSSGSADEQEGRAHRCYTFWPLLHSLVLSPPTLPAQPCCCQCSKPLPSMMHKRPYARRAETWEITSNCYILRCFSILCG